MIKVNIRTNVPGTEPVFAAPTDTVKSVLDARNIDYGGSAILCNGSTVRDFNTTFEALGVTNECFIAVVAKTDNA